MLRLALIGCGGHSESSLASALAHYVAQNPGVVELTAACDTAVERARRFCQQYGFARPYSDLDEMLRAEKPDGVFSILPVEKTAEVGTLLLQRGIPCVLEKPPGVSLEAASALAETSRQTGTPHMVSMNRRFNPYLNRAIGWAAAIGPLRYVRGQMFRSARREADFLWGTGVHVVDAMRHVAGEIIASDRRTPGHNSESIPWFVIDVQFASGCTGTIEIFPTAGMVEERFELFGDDYRACVTTMGGSGEAVRAWRQGRRDLEESAKPDAPLFLRDGSYEETTAFLDGLTHGAPLRPTVMDVLPTLQICQMDATK